jgi:hypothetical protein
MEQPFLGFRDVMKHMWTGLIMIHNTQVRCLHLCHFLAVIKYKKKETLEYKYKKIVIQTVHKINTQLLSSEKIREKFLFGKKSTKCYSFS